MPVLVRDTVNFELGNRELRMLDDSARFIVRRMVADAYAMGFQDGRFDERQASATDAQAKRDATPSLETKEADRG